MLVTCCITKERIEKENAYIVPQESGRNKYYKSYEVYKNELDKVSFYEDLKLFSGLRMSDKIPVEVYSFFSNINSSYSWTEIYKALLFKANDIKDCRVKDFNSTSNKLLYVAKIVESGLVINQKQEQIVRDPYVDEEMYNELLTNKAVQRKRSVLSTWKKGI